MTDEQHTPFERELIDSAAQLQELLTPDELDDLERDVMRERAAGEKKGPVATDFMGHEIDQVLIAALMVESLVQYQERRPLPFEFGELHQETTEGMAADGAVRFHAHVNGEQFCFTVHRCKIRPKGEGLARRADGSRSAFSPEGADAERNSEAADR